MEQKKDSLLHTSNVSWSVVVKSVAVEVTHEINKTVSGKCSFLKNE